MPRPPLPRWVAAALVGTVLAGGAGLAGWAVDLPYFAFSPGPVGDAVGAVRVSDSLPSHPVDGQLLMLTVAARELNAFELLAAVLDPTVDVVRREAVQAPGESDEEFARRQAALMRDAIDTATAVALDRAGIDVEPDGVRIVGVDPSFPAGAVLEAGDVLREVEGTAVREPGEVLAVLAGRAPGDVVSVVVERQGRLRTLEVELGSAEGAERGVLGIRIGPYFAEPPVAVDSEEVGGPSAGLMYTLAILELVDETDLSEGRIIAGTGTVAPDGTVGPIGGVRQKVVAADAAGAEIVLVPEANLAEASSAPHENVALVPVASVDDAVAYLTGAAA